MMTTMTRVGEETGKLERSMLTLSEHFQHQIATRRWFLSSITWPALQLVAAIGVISLLILIMGMFDMSDVLGLGLEGWLRRALVLVLSRSHFRRQSV